MSTGNPLVPEGLLLSCKDAPDDDAPRLILADWLDDHGDPERAEFIRLQCILQRCALTRGWEDLEDPLPHRIAMRTRMARLQQRNETRWVGPLREAGVPFRWYRGFIEIQGPGDLDQPWHDGWLIPALAPWIEGYRLKASIRLPETAGSAPGMTRWGPEAILDRVTRLTFEYPLRHDEDRELLGRCLRTARELTIRATINDKPDPEFFGSLNLQHLRVLRVLPPSSGRAGLAALFTRAFLPNLRVLQFFDSSLPDAVLSAFLARPEQANLRCLGLSRLGGQTCQTLATASHWQNLEELSLVGSRATLGAETVAALARSTALPRLARLDLAGNAFGEGLEALLGEGPLLGNVTHFRLGRNQSDSKKLRTLLHQAPLERLTCLELPPVQTDFEAIQALTSSPRLGSLETLSLHEWNLGAPALEALADSPLGQRLQFLNLPHLQMEAQGAKHLGKMSALTAISLDEIVSSPCLEVLQGLIDSPAWRRLRFLKIVEDESPVSLLSMLAQAPPAPLEVLDLCPSRSDNTPQVMENFGRWHGLQRVAFLSLWGPDLSDRVVETLLQSPHLESLVELRLSFTHITAAKADFLAAWPGLHRLVTLELRGTRLFPEEITRLHRLLCRPDPEDSAPLPAILDPGS